MSPDIATSIIFYYDNRSILNDQKMIFSTFLYFILKDIHLLDLRGDYGSLNIFFLVENVIYGIQSQAHKSCQKSLLS